MGWSSYKLLFTVMVVMTSVVLWSPMAASERAHVYIYNFLELGPTLTVHCRSKDDDLGDQDLPPKDYWPFSFGLDFLNRSRFDCTFKWNDEVHSYPIYIQTRDVFYCKNCTWAIFQAGPCRLLENDSKLCYPWAS